MTEIAGKAAVVTGGGSGIGQGLAMALADAGAKVVVADILKDRAEAVAEDIRQAGGEAIALLCDVSDRASVRRMKADANAAFGPVALMFANAGATSFDKVDGITDAEMDWILEVNLKGVANCAQMFLPDMIAGGDGHIVATASMAGLVPSFIADHVPYAASKLGAIGFILALRREIVEFGVEASVLCPGPTASQMAEVSKYRPARFGGPFEKQISPPANHKRATHFRPPSEVADMVLLAVRKNRPLIVTDQKFRQLFMDQYVDVVLQGFDELAEFEAGQEA